MRKRIPKILITGGAGFIGSAFVRLLAKKGNFSLVVADSLTYAGDLQRLGQVKGKFKFYQVNICNKKQIDLILAKEKPGIIVHFAAESHVDRSINDATAFIDTNIKGTQILMDASRKHKVNKFIFISTDEVYGEIAFGKFNENSP
ncbi:MAG TPA: GDP-mannose 4,6-dehydratase, partial [Candidatus Omnitrophota bacterium]|nr:GDP-mannose 4,6-dehydratase [Candidatus Omnitrophota bacterium]